MSPLLRPSRLWWLDGRGVVCHDGVRIELRRHPPILQKMSYIEADWPTGPWECREGCSARRDMTHDEIVEALRWLQAVAAEARDAVDGGVTLAVVVLRK